MCADCLEDFDPAITLEMNDQALSGDQDLTDGAIATAIQTDQTVALELGQPRPATIPHRFQVFQAGVPAIKSHDLRLKLARLGGLDHVSKVFVLAQAILSLVVNAKVAGQATVTTHPHQRNQVDALHHPPMLARPMAAHQRHFRGIGLIQCAIVDYQYAALALHHWPNLLPQACAVGWHALQQARIGVMRWRVVLGRMCLRGFHAAKHLPRRDQKVDIVQFIAFGWIHASSLASPPSTA